MLIEKDDIDALWEDHRRIRTLAINFQYRFLHFCEHHVDLNDEAKPAYRDLVSMIHEVTKNTVVKP